MTATSHLPAWVREVDFSLAIHPQILLTGKDPIGRVVGERLHRDDIRWQEPVDHPTDCGIGTAPAKFTMIENSAWVAVR